ncbi:hypothetical protein KBZ18_08380 [Synechococcus sp. Cruz-9H2]|uniref:hypothetical protein n=1 Tax=unclassified Synechococcus TaxID=2626047 RepID=UPI0020CC8930|nr:MULTISPECIES: hypothetical protein [unclassified Synechococcus]MCP9819506.1 hypothetical protein [Synechococcus sp. Cruz-9H2]MCP9843810.1 hypothetical protein [Synechococcus sp. Edmonson 11F2]MCP9855832.1 hypothetical protein [Synechococcus sp. Cruz-9C9]MCP9863220.1 hypothetical protein [Synechococcus sp. Cruz-7E5]MCP9870467.1 hypothetical protein [Synechococcus sp. Cruz-7B9]
MASIYPACPLPRNGGSMPPHSSIHRPGYIEGGHQLEKLEFALAIAISRGDTSRADQLRSQIDVLGDLGEEPGT